MSFNRYYQEELTYLRELGKDFARDNPKLAPYLGESGQDPDVERLLEGFAFLTGRLRQKLDDELPELTHTLLDLVWPHFLRPVPAMSVLEFEPLPNAISERKTVAKGVEVSSIPVAGTSCQFRTCYDVDIYPLELEEAEVRVNAAGAALALTCSLHPGVSFDKLDLSSLRFHLHGDASVTHTLYLWLRRYLGRVTVSTTRDSAERRITLPANAVKPVGFAEREGILPYPANAFPGFRPLQEYFALPEKFLFVDLTGLDAARSLGVQDRFEILFQFDRPFDDHLRVTRDNVRLFCTPVVNLFSHDADPVRWDDDKIEQRLRPSGDDPSHYETYCIDSVEGMTQDGGERRTFKSFESFDHAISAGADSDRPTYYRSRLRPSVMGRGMDTYISVVNGHGAGVRAEGETLSVALTCTNRHLTDELRPGDITQAGGNAPEFATVRNIGRVTSTVAPPLDHGLDWQLVSNLSLNYGSLANVEALRHVIGTYDFRACYDRQAERERDLRLQGIATVTSKPLDLLFKGLPVRGLRTTMEMRESKFASAGDMYLFASVLNHFFAMYANINSFHQLVVRGLERGEVYEWAPSAGEQPLL